MKAYRCVWCGRGRYTPWGRNVNPGNPRYPYRSGRIHNTRLDPAHADVRFAGTGAPVSAASVGQQRSVAAQTTRHGPPQDGHNLNGLPPFFTRPLLDDPPVTASLAPRRRQRH